MLPTCHSGLETAHARAVTAARLIFTAAAQRRRSSKSIKGHSSDFTHSIVAKFDFLAPVQVLNNTSSNVELVQVVAENVR